MAQIKRIHDHPYIAGHVLYILECRAFRDIVPAVASLSCRHFVTLLVADFTTITHDELVRVSHQMIDAGCRCFCAWGQGCKAAHLAFDFACCQFETESGHLILTDDHSHQTLEYAIWYTLNCAHPVGPNDRDCLATVAICVNAKSAGQAIREAFSDPGTFSDQHGPGVDDAT